MSDLSHDVDVPSMVDVNSSACIDDVSFIWLIIKLAAFLDVKF